VRRVPPAAETTFLFDVDNTLLDNDRIEADISQHIEEQCGAAMRERFWTLFEALRGEFGFADYLGALQRLRLEFMLDPRVLELGSFLLEYPLASRLYPRALQTLAHVARWGRTVIVSDGDAVLQPRKIRRTGIWDAVGGRVLIYVHKERMLDDIKGRYPAQRYVMVDDKPGILAAMKKIWGLKLTSVFVQQGHYARVTEGAGANAHADMAIAHIADLMDCNYSDFSAAI
jgi:FMN phosphatase YigB (HAD superfamily)